MPIKVSRRFATRLEQVPILTREDWGVIGRTARERIIRRTLASKDENNQTFAPYTRRYVAQRLKAGVEVNSSRPTMQLSGEMLRAIVVSPDDYGVTLKFNA